MNSSEILYASADIDSTVPDFDVAPKNRAKVQPILAAISSSASGRETLITAAALARESGGRLVLLQSVELNIPGEERGIARAELLRELMLAAEARLTALARNICGDVPFSVIVREGPPCGAILRTAHRCGARAIVLGPRRSGWLGFLRRNNLRTVLQNAGRPVYLVTHRQSSPAHLERHVAVYS